MRALVISGGGSKGAFAGGVAQYLMENQGREYDLFLGSSTGSLLIPFLGLGEVDRVKQIYCNVNQRSIFSLSPFIKRKRKGKEFISINYLSSLWQFLKHKRTFGESKALRRTIRKNFSEEDFSRLKASGKKVVVTASNLTKNRVEYKSIADCTYDEFCDWVWISCNYVPFMSLVKKNDCEYADGGFGCLIPIREAINRGATEVDVVILDSETLTQNITVGANPFSLMVTLFTFMWDQLRQHDVTEGGLAALHKDAKLNIYYTPEKLTDNSLIFNKEQMRSWWKLGIEHAKNKFENKVELSAS